MIGGLGFDLQYDGEIETNVLGYAGLRCYLIKANNGLFINGLIGSSFDVEDIDKFADRLELGLGLGYSFFLNNSLSFEPIVNIVKPKPFNDNSYIYTFGGGLSIFFNASERVSSHFAAANTLNKGDSFLNAGTSNFGIITTNFHVLK